MWIDRNGNPTQPPTFNIMGSGIDHMTISFDAFANQYATELQFSTDNGANWETRENDKISFFWNTQTPVNSVMMRITKWSAPKFGVRITSILIGLTKTYNRSQLQRVKAGSQSVADNRYPVFGVLGQTGSMELIDLDGNLLELAELGLLVSGLQMQVWFENTKLGDFTSGKWNYMYGSRTVKVPLQDMITGWNEIVFSGIANHEDNTAWTFFEQLRAVTPEQVNVNPEKQAELESINLPDGFLRAGNLNDAWNEFCDATLSKIYKAIDGSVVLI